MNEMQRHCQEMIKKLKRLNSMDSNEITTRGRQAITKWLERVGLLDYRTSQSGIYMTDNNKLLPGSVPLDFIRHAAFIDNNENQNDGGELLELFKATGRSRFFSGLTDSRTLSILGDRMPEVKEQIVTQAEGLSKGYFDLLGYSRLSFGKPVDWHFDPISGRRAPFLHWSLIDPLDVSVVGDSKVTWELSRHQWLICLGQAYRFTGDERFAECFASRVRAWIRSNPTGTGINWASSLEIAYRLISWCWALYLFRDAKALTPALFVEILTWIRAHAVHIERYLSLYFSPNTHLIGEALGLFYAGIVFPELSEADKWRFRGRQILIEQIDRQVYPDGVHFEQSICYQRYTVDIYLHFLILAQKHGVVIPDNVVKRVQAMLDYLVVMRLPNGAMPQVGDSDGGTLLPLVRRSAADFSGLFAVAAAYFKRADYAWAAGKLTPEVIWLLGSEGVEEFDKLKAEPPSNPPSRLFDFGGYVVMRNNWNSNAHQLILDAGPLGCDITGGHGHADLLSIQCALFGEHNIVDSGTYCYTQYENWRNYFRSTSAHNTVTVDGLNQSYPEGPFKWRNRPKAHLRRWVSNDVYDFTDADHNAYHFLEDPVTHRRRVFFVKPRYWLVVDDLYGSKIHHIELSYQFAPMDVKLSPDGWVIARQDDDKECRLLVSANSSLKTKLVKGGLDPIEGWVSPDYGQRIPAYQLKYGGFGQLPMRIISLLLPADNLSGVPPVVAVAKNHDRVDLIFEDGLETLLIGEKDITLERVPEAELEQ